MTDFIKPLGELPKVVLGHHISSVFLDTIGCPHEASNLIFTIGANGTLKCSAVVWDYSDPKNPQQVLCEWEVLLKTTDAFYQVLTGKIK